MNAFVRRACFPLVALSMAVAAPAAWAQQQPSKAAVAEASTRFKKGMELFKEADYRAALASPIAKAHAVTSRVDTRIDYVWLSAPLATAVEGVRAVTRRTDVSDHHPVVVELRANMDVNES